MLNTNKKKLNFNLKFSMNIFFIAILLAFVIAVLSYNFYEIASVECNFYTKLIPLIHSNIFIYLITLFVLGSIIGWRFIFSIIKQPSSLKQKLANGYIILLVSVLNHKELPTRFIFFTTILGAFLGRRLIWFLSIPYPKSLLVIFFFPFLFFYLSFILVYGYFVLCVKYPKIFGKFLINFFEKNASKEVLRLIDPGEKELSINKKKRAFKKRNAYNKIKKRKLKKLNFKKRKYSTTRKVSGIYEVYASVKTAAWPGYLVYNKVQVIEVGKALDKAAGISSKESFNILDKCTVNQELCSFYITELAKSPETRNLATDIYSTIKADAKVEVSWSQKEGFEVKADVQVPLENKDLRKGIQVVTDAKAEVTKVVTDSSAEVLKKGKNALIHGTGKAGLVAVPTALISANITAALNSPTYPQSLDSARRDFSRIEGLGSFDSNESTKDRLTKFKRHNSAKF